MYVLEFVQPQIDNIEYRYYNEDNNIDTRYKGGNDG